MLSRKEIYKQHLIKKLLLNQIPNLDLSLYYRTTDNKKFVQLSSKIEMTDLFLQARILKYSEIKV